MSKILAANGWFAASLAILVMVAVTDRYDAEHSLVSACAVAPFLASATCSVARTTVVSVASLVVAGWLIGTQDGSEMLTVMVRVGVIVLAALLAPVVAAARTKRERRIRDLSRVAQVAQGAILTPVPPRSGALRLSSAYESASREALIGGDLFGVVESPGQTRLLVGDVKGKGVDAVKTAALTLAAFREAGHHSNTLEEVARYSHAQLLPHLTDEDFVTAVFASVDEVGVLEVVSCGHPAPFLMRSGDLTPIDVPEPAGPLGLSVDAGAPVARRVQLRSGDRVLFYTDGLVEARDGRGAFVDVRRLADSVGDSGFDDALPELLRRLHATADTINDDLALLLVEYTGVRAGTRDPADGLSAGNSHPSAAAKDRAGPGRTRGRQRGGAVPASSQERRKAITRRA